MKDGSKARAIRGTEGGTINRSIKQTCDVMTHPIDGNQRQKQHNCLLHAAAAQSTADHTLAAGQPADRIRRIDKRDLLLRLVASLQHRHSRRKEQVDCQERRVARGGREEPFNIDGRGWRDGHFFGGNPDGGPLMPMGMNWKTGAGNQTPATPWGVHGPRRACNRRCDCDGRHRCRHSTLDNCFRQVIFFRKTLAKNKQPQTVLFINCILRARANVYITTRNVQYAPRGAPVETCL